MPESVGKDQPEPLIVGVAETARLLDISKWYVYQLMNEGELPSFKVGQMRKVLVADVHAYISRLQDKEQRLQAAAASGHVVPTPARARTLDAAMATRRENQRRRAQVRRKTTRKSTAT